MQPRCGSRVTTQARERDLDGRICVVGAHVPGEDRRTEGRGCFTQRRGYALPLGRRAASRVSNTCPARRCEMRDPSSSVNLARVMVFLTVVTV